MTEYVCRVCKRVIDLDLEPSPGEPRHCADCWADSEREFGEWIRAGWS